MILAWKRLTVMLLKSEGERWIEQYQVLEYQFLAGRLSVYYCYFHIERSRSVCMEGLETEGEESPALMRSYSSPQSNAKETGKNE